MYTAMKIGGMVLVIACTTSIGISFARALTERVRELERTLAALSSLVTELSYSLAPPAEAVAKLDERETESAAFIPACASLCRRGKPFPQAWREAALMFHGALSQEDAEILAGLSDTLGQCGLEGELSSLEHTRTLLSMQLDTARARSATHGRLYRTLGLLTGAFVIIFFI